MRAWQETTFHDTEEVGNTANWTGARPFRKQGVLPAVFCDSCSVALCELRIGVGERSFRLGIISAWVTPRKVPYASVAGGRPVKSLEARVALGDGEGSVATS